MQLIIGENALDSEEWELFETDTPLDTLIDFFGTWPENARLYRDVVSQETDITPGSPEAVEALATIEATRLYAIVYPGDPITIVIAVVAVAAAAAAAFLLSPSIPNAASVNNTTQSSNNELSNRSNKSRPNSRIPDIYGTVRSIPDLIALPYKIFENNLEIEKSYLCIGRGEYDIPISEIKDDTTRLDQISGISAAIYGPNTSPNFGTPSIVIGPYVAEPLLNTKRYTSVNGQTLQGPNFKSVSANIHFTFKGPNEAKIDSGSDRLSDFDEIYSQGDSIILTDSGNLSGTYTISSVTAGNIYFDAPGLVNNNWNLLSTSAYTAQRSASLAPSTPIVAGPFISDDAYATQAILNFVAPNGLYSVNEEGDNKRIDVTLELTFNKILPDNSFGPSTVVNYIMKGSSADRSQRAVTYYRDLGFTGPFAVTVKRVTPLAIDEKGSWVEEVKWRDFYSSSVVSQPHFGNVTTIFASTKATTGALAVKDRKLSALVTRKVPVRVSGTTFTAPQATNSAANILVAVSLDPYIGNRSINELDIDNIFSTTGQIRDYFGLTNADDFSYTFDNSNLSFEETVSSIANVIFCTAYRRGNVIKLSFEKETDVSTLLFNHRNKIPDSESRSIRFGNQDNFDGVKYEYVSPEDEAVLTITLPTGAEPINPKQVKSIGVRSYEQAYLQAWRTWNKIRYQNTGVEFEATQEADLLVLKDRILVADNTRGETFDGQIEAIDGLTLTLSQPCPASVGKTIIIQHYDGFTESIPLSAVGSDQYRVVLSAAPRQALSLALDNYAIATYVIVSSADDRTAMPFLVTEKSQADGYNFGVTAVNYDARYYANDKDFI